MAGFYKMNTLRNCVNSFKNVKSLNKFNDKLGKDIQDICNKSKDVTGFLNNIKQVNEAVGKVFLSVRTHSEGIINKLTENSTLKDRLKETSKPLYTLVNDIENKRTQIKIKNIKSKHIRRETQKLCQHISKGKLFGKSFYWTAAGVAATSDSKVDAVTNAAPVEVIPEPPAIPDLATEALNNLNSLGEPTFASLGLGGWSPIGIVQNSLEYLHVALGLDWWAVIVIGTVIIRTLLFPLVIIAQRNAARMNNYLPQMQLLQMKMTEARQVGDSLNAARYGQEMMLFMKEKGLNPLKNMIVPLAQAPIFLSFFMGLREMANVPVASLAHGGLFWFTDLTLPDQFFILPIITSATLALTIELGTDGAKLNTQNMMWVKYGLRALPLIILPFTVNFPGAILCYWVSTNLISLVQVSFLRLPKVRTYFNIEQMVTHAPEQLPIKPKGFTAGLKDSWTNVKITKELEERRRLDEMQFKKAGKGPIQKTFKFDPTKHISATGQTPISAKKR